MKRERIGFVGVGLMGHGMASNLLKAGYPLCVIAHRNREPVDDLVSRGATEATDYPALCHASDCIIICVSNSRAVDSVIDGIDPHLGPTHVVIDCSTSDPVATQRNLERISARGASFADVPVTGGAQQAAEAALGGMVGAESQVLERIRPILSAFCSRIAHFGPPTSGHSAKLINNYLVLAMVAAITDTYRVARRCNIDWAQLYDVMKCGSNYSEALRRIIEPALDSDYDGYRFSADNALKDISYYLSFAGERGLASPLARETANFFQNAVDQGHGDLMLSRLIDPESGDKDA